MISKAMEPFMAGSSQIRAMFEEGKRMAKIYGKENVYDFSIGNPGLKPPQEVLDQPPARSSAGPRLSFERRL